eukprot:COSAG06_NODE_1915_length_8072_cov_15.416405_1_plen_479_part_00
MAEVQRRAETAWVRSSGGDSGVLVGSKSNVHEQTVDVAGHERGTTLSPSHAAVKTKELLVELRAWAVEVDKTAPGARKAAAIARHAAGSAPPIRPSPPGSPMSTHQTMARLPLIAQRAATEMVQMLTEQNAQLSKRLELDKARVEAWMQELEHRHTSQMEHVRAEAEALVQAERACSRSALVAAAEQHEEAMANQRAELLKRIETAATENRRRVVTAEDRLAEMTLQFTRLQANRRRARSRMAQLRGEVAALKAERDDTASKRIHEQVTAQAKAAQAVAAVEARLAASVAETHRLASVIAEHATIDRAKMAAVPAEVRVDRENTAAVGGATVAGHGRVKHVELSQQASDDEADGKVQEAVGEATGRAFTTASTVAAPPSAADIMVIDVDRAVHRDVEPRLHARVAQTTSIQPVATERQQQPPPQQPQHQVEVAGSDGRLDGDGSLARKSSHSRRTHTPWAVRVLSMQPHGIGRDLRFQ